MHQICEFQRRQRDGFDCVVIQCFARIRHARTHGVAHHVDDVQQSSRVSIACFKRLAARPVDGPEIQVFQVFHREQIQHFRHAEYLFKVQLLTRVRQIPNLVRVVVGFTIPDGGQIGRFVRVSATGIVKHERRHRFGVAVAADGNDFCAVAGL